MLRTIGNRRWRACRNFATTIMAMALVAVVVSANKGSKNHARGDWVASMPSLGSGHHRTEFVRQTLCDRSDQVLSGKRSQQFGRFMKDHPEEMNILSMHGVEVAEDSIPTPRGGSTNIEAASSSTGESVSVRTSKASNFPITKKRHTGPFPENCMDLDIHSDPSEPWSRSYYKGEVEEWDRKAPSALALMVRFIQLAFHFFPVVVTALLAYISTYFRQNYWYRWIATALASSGAAFIKWGQWASTRSDMFPEGLCDELEMLHSSAPAHSWEHTEMSVESSLDIPQGSLLDVFSSFDIDPIASGSIAQIHKARLPNGDCLAVKVRHPKVAERIDLDFRLMTRLARIADRVPSLAWLHIGDSVAQFSHTMAAQAHLNVEAHHLEIFNHNFEGWRQVRFPKPIYASSKVIMETFEPGKITTDILEIYEEQADAMEGDIRGYELMPLPVAQFLVSTGVSFYLKMLLVDNLMHADLHPGNIMLDVLKAQESKEGKAIALVDAGMVAQLAEEESVNFVGLLISLGEGDGHAAAQHSMRFSKENKMTPEAREAFSKDMEKLFNETCRGYGTGVDVGEVLRGVLGLIRDHRVRIDANYATLVVNVLCVQSLAQRVCPAYNVLDASQPMLQSYAKLCFEDDRITPKPPEKTAPLVRFLMPIMHWRKKQADKKFFREYERKHQPRLQELRKILSDRQA